MPHQSFVVNLKYVKDIKNYELLMTNGEYPKVCVNLQTDVR